MRIWDRFLTDRDREVYGNSGWGKRAGFGQRPAGAAERVRASCANVVEVNGAPFRL